MNNDVFFSSYFILFYWKCINDMNLFPDTWLLPVDSLLDQIVILIKHRYNVNFNLENYTFLLHFIKNESAIYNIQPCNLLRF